MAFRGRLVSVGAGAVAESIELLEGNIIYGRKDFAPHENRLSRSVCETNFSPNSGRLTVTLLARNPATIIKGGSGKRITLNPNDSLFLTHGDTFCPLKGLEDTLAFRFHLENVAVTMPNADAPEETTQLDLNLYSPDDMQSIMPLADEDMMSVDMERDRHASIATRTRSQLNQDAHAQRKRKAEDAVVSPNKRVRGLDATTASTSSSSHSSHAPLAKEESFRIGAPKILSSELTKLKVLGKGSCGEVSLCLWKGTKVAVKKIFHSLLKKDALSEFRQEAEILAALRHPNIVLLLGTSTPSERDYLIVTEFMNRGSLRDVLNNHEVELPLPLRVRMLHDAATGMNHLHTCTPPIIHRDLKSQNLLVDDDFKVKVTDFGLARFNPNRDETRRTFCGTLPWCAPEVFGKVGYSFKADVYSFGVVIWEMLTRAEPYTGMKTPEIIFGVVKEEMRPPLAPIDQLLEKAKEANDRVAYQALDELRSLMIDCWATNPDKRPDFMTIVNRIRIIRERLEGDGLMKPPPRRGRAAKTVAASDPVTASVSVPQILLNELTIEDEIELEGKPDWVKVVRARYRGQGVQVKMLADNAGPEYKRQFLHEITVLASIKSSRCVVFYGANTAATPWFLVTDMGPATLLQAMTRPRVKFDWDATLDVSVSLAEAINALHCWKPPLLHGHLTTSAILVDKSWIAKLSDFSHARYENEVLPSDEPQSPPTIYQPPETQHYAKASDIYSFGIILWELIHRCLTGKYIRAFSEFNLKFDYQIAVQSATKGLRPTISPKCPEPLAALIQQCWHPIPAQRPSSEEVLRQLNMVRDVYNQQRGGS